jgi:hypothetical protein
MHPRIMEATVGDGFIPAPQRRQPGPFRSENLLDDMRDTAQTASIFSLIGRGCHRVSGIAGGLGKPATSLGRPLQRLMEMALVEREVPFGAAARGSKKTLCRIADPSWRAGSQRHRHEGCELVIH